MNPLRTARHRALTLALPLALGGLALFGALVALTPLHLTLSHAAGDEPRLRANGRPAVLVRRAALGRHELVVENRSADAQPVQLLPLRTSLGNTVAAAALQVERGEWRVAPPDGRLVSTVPGSRVRFTGLAGDLTLGVVLAPDQGTVAVADRVEPLAREAQGVLELPVASPRALSTTSRTFGWRPLQLTVERARPGTVLELTVANRPLRTWTVPASGALAVEVTRTQVLGELVRGYAAGARLVLLALGVLLALLLAGAHATLAWPRSTSRLEAAAFAASAALATGSVVATSLSYVLERPAVTALVVALVAVAAVAGAWRLVRAGPPSPHASPAHGLAGVAVLGTGLVLGLVGAFWPLFHVGGWFLGQLQTDAYYYTGLPERLADHSLTSLDSLNGFGMRALELVQVGVLSSALGLPTREGMVVSALLTFLLSGWLAYAASLRVTRSPLAAGLVGALAYVSVPAASLYMEGYFTQYLLVFGLAFAAAAAAALLERVEGTGPVLALATEPLLFVAACAFCLTVYPYFTLLPVSVLLVVAAARRRALGPELAGAAKLAALGLALCNANLLVVLNVGKTAYFVERLNEIARNVVFPFYREPRFLSFVLGLSPFHASTERVGEHLREFGTAGRGVVAAGHAFTQLVNGAPFAFGVAALLLLALAVSWRGWWPRPAARMLVLSLGVYVLVAAVMDAREQTYSYAKLLWTLGALLPFVLAIPLLAPPPGRPTAPAWRLAVVGALVLVSTVALPLNAINWYGSSRGAATRMSHVSTYRDLAGTVAAVEARVAERPGRRAVAFTQPSAALQGTDKERVMLGQFVPALSHLGIACVDCAFSQALGTVDSVLPVDPCASDASLVVAIGHPGFRCAPDDRVLFDGDFVAVTERSGY